MSLRPTFGPIWLACRQCGHTWDDWQPQSVPLKTWTAHVKTYRCPHCGAASSSLLLRTTRLEGDGG